jgi:hypothetical protein
MDSYLQNKHNLHKPLKYWLHHDFRIGLVISPWVAVLTFGFASAEKLLKVTINTSDLFKNWSYCHKTFENGPIKHFCQLNTVFWLADFEVWERKSYSKVLWPY